MSKKPRSRKPLDKQLVNGSKKLLKSAQQQFYHIALSL